MNFQSPKHSRPRMEARACTAVTADHGTFNFCGDAMSGISPSTRTRLAPLSAWVGFDRHDRAVGRVARPSGGASLLSPLRPLASDMAQAGLRRVFPRPRDGCSRPTGRGRHLNRAVGHGARTPALAHAGRASDPLNGRKNPCQRSARVVRKRSAILLPLAQFPAEKSLGESGGSALGGGFNAIKNRLRGAVNTQDSTRQ